MDLINSEWKNYLNKKSSSKGNGSDSEGEHDNEVEYVFETGNDDSETDEEYTDDASDDEDNEIDGSVYQNKRHEFIDNCLQEQIELVGSEYLYTKVVGNMKAKYFDKFLIREQCALYEWRSDFFSEHLGYGEEDEAIWYTDGGGDQRCFDTVDYQIVHNFDNLMEIACKLKFGLRKILFVKNDEDIAHAMDFENEEPTSEYIPSQDYRIHQRQFYGYNGKTFFLCNDEVASNEIRSRYSREDVEKDIKRFEEGDYNDDLTYSERICFVAEMNGMRRTLRSLKDIAFRYIIRNDLDTACLPEKLRKEIKYMKSESFHFKVTKRDLDWFGKELYTLIKNAYSLCDYDNLQEYDEDNDHDNEGDTFTSAEDESTESENGSSSDDSQRTALLTSFD